MPSSQRALPSWAGALLLLALAVGLRAADFGSPIIHPDEQYHLLVGQRMLDGWVPYVDIWDRRPIGLFLVYAGAAALPGDDIWGYQLLATLFAGLTAVVVAAGARTLGASRSGAFAAGVVYLIWLPLLGGRGGQAAVFAALPIACAALLTLRLPALGTPPPFVSSGVETREPGTRPRFSTSLETNGEKGAIFLNGALAGLLAGLAIQISTGAAFEAAFFLIAHMWWLRRARAPIATTVGAAIVWLGLILAPTIAAMLAFRAMGPAALDAWTFANVTAILQRPAAAAGEIAMRLLGVVAQLSPLLLCAGIAWRRRRVRLIGERAIALGWLTVAVGGFLAAGTYHDHHALPLVAPLAMIAGIALGRIPRVLVGTVVLGLLLMVVERAFIGHDAAGVRTVARVVAANDREACPYVFTGDVATYTLSRACVPTSRAFPDFLSLSAAAGTTGIDAPREVRRVLATRPPVIVASTRRLGVWNPNTAPLLQDALARDYRPVFSTPRSTWRTVVFLRRDLDFIR